MRLHHQLLKRSRADGFTLTELLVAASIGVLLSLVAGEALVSHLQSNARLEYSRRALDWRWETSASPATKLSKTPIEAATSSSVSVKPSARERFSSWW